MNANAFRHFYDYHFSENRKIWDRYISQLSPGQFTQHVDYSHGSVRDQIVHLIGCDDTWFSELRGVQPSDPPLPTDVDDREIVRAYGERVEQSVRAYLAELQDEMVFAKPIEEPDEDKDLVVWQVLLHVVNHGTDHRAQILRLLNDLGIKTEYQDYIFYVYDHPISQETGMDKSELLKWLQEEYRGWEGFLDQIGPARMDQPGVAADWSVKDMVAHLAGWNRWLVARLEAAGRREPQPSPPWPADLQTDDEINGWIYESHRGRSVREVLEESQQVFQRLLDVIKDLPEDVRVETIEKADRAYYLVWVDEQRFPAGEFFDHFHDDHEPDLRAWLTRLEQA